jgi:transcriptional regulator GlxA family with amidase domain
MTLESVASQPTCCYQRALGPLERCVCPESSCGFGDSRRMLGDVLMCGCYGVDAMAVVANTGVMARSVLILGFSGVQSLDLTGPSEVFTSWTLCLDGMDRADEGYDVHLVSRNGEPATTGAGLALVAEPPRDPRGPVDTIVLPGRLGTDAAQQNPDVIGWIQIAAGNAPRLVSVCTGAFLAAQAGLPDGCVATTDWAFAGQLAHEFPKFTVDPELIFVRSSDQAWAAAGVTAGIDLALSWSRTTTPP